MPESARSGLAWTALLKILTLPNGPGIASDKLYERRWAETILERVLARLRVECDGSGKQQRFDVLKSFLLGVRGELPTSEAAESGWFEANGRGLFWSLRGRNNSRSKNDEKLITKSTKQFRLAILALTTLALFQIDIAPVNSMPIR